MTTAPEIDLCDGAFWGGDFHAGLTWLRENDPVHWDGAVWGITTHALLKEASRSPERFSSAQGIRPESPMGLPMMIDKDDPEHVRRRKLVNSGFTPRRIRDSEPAIRRACDEIIDKVSERGECEFVMEVAAWLPLIMIGDALGVAPEDRATLLKWSDDMVSAQGSKDGAMNQAVVDAYSGFREFASAAIEQRRIHATDDLLSVLVHAEIEGEHLSDDDIIHEALLILIGGDETTRHVINGGLYQLLIDPEARQALTTDPTKLPLAIEEMLRWVSPVRNMARTVVADTEFGGKHLKEGDKALLLYPSANRDATIFADPFHFDIERTPNEHVAFGFGTHFCLGASLARLELRCMFEQVLQRLPYIELVEPTEPTNRPANFVSGYEQMHVRFTPTAPTGRR